MSPGLSLQCLTSTLPSLAALTAGSVALSSRRAFQIVTTTPSPQPPLLSSMTIITEHVSPALHGPPPPSPPSLTIRSTNYGSSYANLSSSGWSMRRPCLAHPPPLSLTVVTVGSIPSSCCHGNPISMGWSPQCRHLFLLCLRQLSPSDRLPWTSISLTWLCQAYHHHAPAPPSSTSSSFCRQIW